jgi:hypothetical protein
VPNEVLHVTYARFRFYPDQLLRMSEQEIPGAAISGQWERRLVHDSEGIRQECTEPRQQSYVSLVSDRIADEVETCAELKSEERCEFAHPNKGHVVHSDQVLEAPHLRLGTAKVRGKSPLADIQRFSPADELAHEFAHETLAPAPTPIQPRFSSPHAGAILADRAYLPLIAISPNPEGSSSSAGHPRPLLTP